MSDKIESTTNFVKMEPVAIVTPKRPASSRIALLILSFTLFFSLCMNLMFLWNPEDVCPMLNNSDELDSCLVSLENSDDRIMNCLLQRSLEMTAREEAIGECVAELKATELELKLYKKDAEKDVENMSLEDLKKDLQN